MMEWDKISDNTLIVTDGALWFHDKDRSKLLKATHAEFDSENEKIMVQTPAPITLQFTDAGLLLVQPPVYRNDQESHGLREEKPGTIHVIAEIRSEHIQAIETIIAGHSLGHYKSGCIDFSKRGLAIYARQEEAQERRGLTVHGEGPRQVRALVAAFG